MKYLPLVWASLRRFPIRTALSFLSIAAAFVLLGTMYSVTTGYDRLVNAMSETRLRVTNRSGMTQLLPIAHESTIASLPEVLGVTHYAYVGGYFQDRSNGVPMGALDIEGYATAVPELILPSDQRQRMASTRTGAIVGAELAAKYGWQIGDTVPIIAPAWKRRDGDNTWTVDIVGVYQYKDAAQPSNELWINYAYFDEAREASNGMVMMFIVSIPSSVVASQVSQSIDEKFANSSFETLTQNEKDWVSGRLSQLGGISLFVSMISGAVLFTLLLLTTNTMTQSVQQRRPQLALLKAFGFSNARVVVLVVSEALVLSVPAALTGLLIVRFMPSSVSRKIGIIGDPVPLSLFVAGIVIATTVALVSAVLPAWRAGHLGVARAMK